MITFSLTDLTSALTVTEARASIYRILARVKVNTTVWAPGDPTRTMAAAASVMFAALSEFQRDIAASGFLEHATGPWLRMIARYVYGVEADDATFATGEIELTNQGGGLYAVDAGDLIVRNASTGRTYRNVASFELGSGIGNKVTLTVMATEAGTASNANAAAISEFVTTLNRVTVTNPTAILGRDAESPAELRAKCREKLGALSPFGPWDAYSYAARTAKLSTGQSIGVTRTLVTRDGFGRVYLTVATPSGALLGPAIDAIDAAVAVAAEPLGVTAIVQSATPVTVPVVYQAWVYNTTGLTLADMRARIAAALATFFSTHPIGGARLTPDAVVGYVFNEAITATIRSALPPGAVFHVTMPGGEGGNTELGAGQVPVLAHNPLTDATINIVKPPEGAVT